jgi:hypothetical protein
MGMGPLKLCLGKRKLGHTDYSYLKNNFIWRLKYAVYYRI